MNDRELLERIMQDGKPKKVYVVKINLNLVYAILLIIFAAALYGITRFFV